MKLHPIKGAKILEEMEEYEDVADVVLAYHERWDVKGYPNGLKGKENMSALQFAGKLQFLPKSAKN